MHHNSSTEQRNNIMVSVDSKAMTGLHGDSGAKCSSFALPSKSNNGSSGGDDDRLSSVVRKGMTCDHCGPNNMSSMTMNTKSSGSSSMANESWDNSLASNFLKTAKATVQSSLKGSNLQAFNDGMMLNRSSGHRTVVGDDKEEFMNFFYTLNHPPSVAAAAATGQNKSRNSSVRPPSMADMGIRSSQKSFSDDDDDDDDDHAEDQFNKDVLNYVRGLKVALNKFGKEPHVLPFTNPRIPSVAEPKGKVHSVVSKSKDRFNDFLSSKSAHIAKGKAAVIDILSSRSSHEGTGSNKMKPSRSFSSNLPALGFFKSKKPEEMSTKPQPFVDWDFDYDEPDLLTETEKTLNVGRGVFSKSSNGSSYLRPPSLKWTDCPPGQHSHLPFAANNSKINPEQVEGQQKVPSRASGGRTRVRRRAPTGKIGCGSASKSVESLYSCEENEADTTMRISQEKKQDNPQVRGQRRAQRLASIGLIQTRALSIDRGELGLEITKRIAQEDKVETQKVHERRRVQHRASSSLPQARTRVMEGKTCSGTTSNGFAYQNKKAASCDFEKSGFAGVQQNQKEVTISPNPRTSHRDSSTEHKRSEPKSSVKNKINSAGSTALVQESHAFLNEGNENKSKRNPTRRSPTRTSSTTAGPTRSSSTSRSPTRTSSATAGRTRSTSTRRSPARTSSAPTGPTRSSATRRGTTRTSSATASPTTASPTTASPTTASPTMTSPTTTSPTTTSPTTTSSSRTSPTTTRSSRKSPTTTRSSRKSLTGTSSTNSTERQRSDSWQSSKAGENRRSPKPPTRESRVSSNSSLSARGKGDRP